MKAINCLIVDDNEMDRLIIEDYISHRDDLNLLGSFSSPVEALEILKSEKIQLLFLDIDMPVINGINFFKKLENPPLCVFITAFPDFALEAFDINAIDYLLKPVKPARFEEAVKRIKEWVDITEKAERYNLDIESNWITIKEGNTINKVMITDIIFLEALANWTKVITSSKRYITLYNLRNFLQELPGERFLRVHRSFAVSKNKINKFHDNEIQLGQYKVAVGKTYRQSVIEFMSRRN